MTFIPKLLRSFVLDFVLFIFANNLMHVYVTIEMKSSAFGEGINFRA
jgi:hypothetical protein